MKVGLIDVDGHNRKTRWGSAYPNLALMKIARYHIEQGDTVEWVANRGRYSQVYQSKIFPSSPDTDLIFDADIIHRGGTGYDLTTMLPKHIDCLQPWYHIYPFIDSRTAYGFLTRGCPNHCKWCVVPAKEGGIHPYMDIEELAIEGRDTFILMDNNILGAGDYCEEQLRKIIHHRYRIDFNQAMDARLVTPHIASLLAQIRWFPYIRFGCDTHAQIDHCDRAIALLREAGWHGSVFLYTMITDDFDESVSRVGYWRDRLMRGEKTYPHVQPYLDFNDPTYQPPKWQKDMARWCGVKSLLKTVPLFDYQPRQGFLFSEYQQHPELRRCRTKEDIAAMRFATN